MNAIQKFSIHRDWRLGLEVGDAVGIIDLLGEPFSGTVFHGDSMTVKVRHTETQNIYRFRRGTGNAIGNCALFLVPAETLETTTRPESSLSVAETE